MRPAILIGLGLGLLSGTMVLAGTPSFEEVLKDMLGTLEKMTTTLSAIKDEDTAKVAVPDLRSATNHFLKLRQKAAAMKPPTEEEKQRVEKEYKVKFMAAQKKLFGEIDRVGTVPGGKDALKEISAAMKSK